VQGTLADNWLRKETKKLCGRRDYKALQAHYSGAASKALNIQQSEAYRENLEYKSERVLPFEKFLTTMEDMSIGFSENGEGLTEIQLIRLLFKKVQHPSLENTKSSLQVMYDLNADNNVDYEFITNSFSAAVALLPEYVQTKRNASGVDSSKGHSPSNGIRGADGKIFTGYYKDFKSLSSEDKTAIIEEGQRLNITPKKTKSRNSGRGASSVKQGKKQVVKLTKQIAALKTRVHNAEKRQAAVSDDSDPEDNAGDQFGGRQAKKAKK
jgi:hypothetical protein